MESVATFNFYLIKISLSSLAGFLYCGKGGDLQTKKMPQLKSGLYKLQCLLHRWSFGNSPQIHWHYTAWREEKNWIRNFSCTLGQKFVQWVVLHITSWGWRKSMHKCQNCCNWQSQRYFRHFFILKCSFVITRNRRIYCTAYGDKRSPHI